jgi:hypothetical protein
MVEKEMACASLCVGIGIYARLEIARLFFSWSPLLALIWGGGARSRDPVQVGYRCLRTLTSLGLRASSCTWAVAGRPISRTRGVIPSSPGLHLYILVPK